MDLAFPTALRLAYSTNRLPAYTKARLKKRPPRLVITTDPPFRRCLRKPARKAVYAAYAARYIRPWVRNPAFRLQQTAPPRASLLGLPPELRQRILEMCVPSEEMARAEFFSAVGAVRGARGGVLCGVIGVLCCVSPVLRVDMGYVGERWVSGEEERMRLGEGGMRGGAVELVRRNGRMRVMRCWYCHVRHPRGDPVCPMERKNSIAWQDNSFTKVIKSRSRALQQPEGDDADEEERQKAYVRFDE